MTVNDFYLILMIIIGLLFLVLALNNGIKTRPHEQYFNEIGMPLSHGCITIYICDILTKMVLLDDKGRCDIIHTPDGVFRMVLSDSNGRIIFNREIEESEDE